MKKSRLAIAALGAMIVPIALAGCSGGGSSGGSSTALTVEDYYNADPGKTSFDKLYKSCASDVGATVKATHVAGAGLIAKVLQQSSSKTLPDVLMLDNPDVAQIADSGALSDLSNYGIDTDGFPKGISNTGKLDGTLYGKQPAANSVALYYNTEMLTAAGITPPKTWAELKSAAAKLTSGSTYGFAFSGINTYEGTWQFLPWMWTNGGDEKNIDTPETAEALQFLVDLVNDGSASKSVVNWSQQDAIDQFLAGKAAMVENGPWQLPVLKAQSKIKWASVPLPTPDANTKIVSPLGGEAYTVPNTGDKTKMALAGKFVKCVTDTSNQQKIAEFNGTIPSTTTIAEKFGESHPDSQSFVTVVQTARARTGELGAKWPEAATKIYTAEQLALTGKMSPSAALKQAQNG